MEKRLVLTIDPSQAERGAKDASTALNRLEKGAENTIATFLKLEQRMRASAKLLQTFNTQVSGKSFAKFSENIANTSTSFSNLQKTISSSEKKFSTLDSKMGAFNTKVGNIKTSLNGLTKSFDTGVTKLEKTTSKIGENFDKLKENTSTASRSINTFNSDVVKLTTRTDALYTSVGNARDVFHQVVTPMTKFASTLSSANESAKNTKSFVDQLNTSIKSSGVNFTALGTKAEKTANSMSYFRERLTLMNRDFTTLKSNVNGLSSQIDSTDAKMKKLGNSFTGLSKSMKDASKGLDLAVNRLKKMDEELNRTKERMKDTQKAGIGMSTSFLQIGAAFGSIGFSMLAMDLVKTIDHFKAMENRLVVVSGSIETVSETMDELLEVSRKSRTSLDATVDVYSKLERVNKRYGLSVQQLMGITTTVAQAVSMSGATVQGAQGAMVQFAQALSGNFQASAQELNSIIEQTPALADALAQGLNSIGEFADITTADLKKLAKEQQLSTRDILQGLLNISEDVNTRFQLSSKLVSQGIQAVKDSFTVYIGRVDKAFGITEKLSEKLFEVAENFDKFKGAIAAAAGGLVTLAAVVGTALFAGLGSLLGVSGIVVTGLVAIGAYTAKWVVENNKVAETIQVIKDTFNGIIDFYKEWEDVINKVAIVVGVVTVAYKAWGQAVLFVNGALLALKALNPVLLGVSLILAGITLGVIEHQQEAARLAEITESAQTRVRSSVEMTYEEYKKLNKESKKLTLEQLKGIQAVEQAQLEALKTSRATFNARVQEIVAMKKLYDTRPEVVKALDETIAKMSIQYQTAGKEIKILEESIGKLDDRIKNFGKDKPDPIITGGGTDLTDKMKDDWKSLQASLDPVIAAQQKFKDDMETLSGVVRKGTPEYSRYAGILKNDLNKALDSNTISMLSYTSASEESINNAKSLSDAWYEISNVGLRLGWTTDQVNKAFVESANKIMGVEDQIKDAKSWYEDYQDSLNPTGAAQREFNEAISHMNVLMATGALSSAEYKKMVDQLGFSLGLTEDWVQSANKALKEYAEDAGNLGKDVEDAMTSALQGMEDALTEFVKTGKFEFSSLVDSILADIARMVVRQTITAPLTNLATSFITGMMGGSTGTTYTDPFGGSFTTNAFAPSAKGNVFNTNGMMKFASGGVPDLSEFANSIVSKTTRFSAGGNPNNIMGEAGAEAIIPLARTSDGDLGVKMTGSGSNVQNNIVIKVEQGMEVSETQERDNASGGKDLEITIKRLVDKNLASGSHDKTMKSRFGISPAGG